MKYFRKIFTSLLLICSPILACIAVYAATIEPTNGEYEMFFAEEDILNAWGAFTESEQMDYAGVYIDGDTVVLLFKEGTDSLKNAIARNAQNDKMLVNQEKKLQQSIVIKSATYSYNDLMEVYDFLVAEAYSLGGVSSVSLSNKGNCIDIGISADACASEIQKKLLAMIQVGTDVTDIADNSILSFHTVTREDEFSYVTSINGNSQLKTTYSNGTICYSAAVRYGEGNAWMIY